MKPKKESRTAPAVLSVIVFAVLLGGCGNSKNDLSPGNRATLPAAPVGLNVCTTCHAAVTTDWLTSKHANASPTGTVDLSTAGSPSFGGVYSGVTYTVGQCSWCHDPLGDSQRLVASWTGNVVRPVVGCESCHGGGSQHYGGPISLLANTTVSGMIGSTPVSAQFNTCTPCHQLLNASGTGPATAFHDPSAGTAPTSTAYIITDTHFATAGTWTPTVTSVNTTSITGYAMDYLNERVCTNCHNPHKPPTQNREWAQSGHADTTAAGPWAHYNWTLASRTVCQRCHTTSGFSALADATAAGTVYTAPLTTNLQFKPEMLECNGCHTDTKGTLRNPGTFVPPSTTAYIFPAGRSIPDATVIAGSAVCVNCHSGRQTGQFIQNVYTDTSVTGNSFAGFNSHYLAAGGILFRTIGYEYAGRDYSNNGMFMHDKIGTASSPVAGTGTNGPCVSCHMQTPEPHLFSAVSRVSDTTPVTGFTATTNPITAVTGSAVCDICHSSPKRTPELMNAYDDQYAQSLRALEAALKARLTSPQICYDQTTHPYFFIYTTTCDTTQPFTAWPDRNTLGAAFNLNLLNRLPGAFAHNNGYTRRLIYDSIDYLDDRTLNYTVGSTLSGGAYTSYPGAKTYLLPAGVTGTADERP